MVKFMNQCYNNYILDKGELKGQQLVFIVDSIFF